MDKLVWAERLLWLFGLGGVIGAVAGEPNPVAVTAAVVMLLAAAGLGVWRGQRS